VQPIRGDNVLFQFFLTLQAVREVMSGLVAGTGITQDEYAVLGLISLLGPIAPTDLAVRLGLPPTTISRYVAGFVDGGLARRVPNPDDRRSYFLEATEHGNQTVAVIAPRIREAVQALGRASSMPLRDIQAALVELNAAARVVVADRGESTTR
jgi:DNA-binding MarR family transcriptional regulator